MPSARHRAAIIAGVVVAAVTYVGHDAASSSHVGGDSSWTTYQSLSVLTEGDLELSEFAEVLDGYRFNWARNHRGEPVNTFPWGSAVLSVPVVAAVALSDALSGRSFEENLRHNFPLHEIENTLASVWVGLTTALLFVLVYRELRSWPAAAVLALTFAFATSAFSTMSRALWSHGPAAFLVTVELLVLQAAERSRRGERLLPLLGPLFVLAYAVRPTTVAASLALAGVVALRHRRRLVSVAAAGVVAGLAYLAVNLATYGALQPSYYNPGRLLGSRTFLEALAGNWVSPQRGLLVWSPVLVFAGAGVAVALRRKAFTVLQGAAVAAIGLHWVLISTLDPWYAGFSTGPRLFGDVLSFFVLLMVPAVDALRAGGGVARHTGRVSFAVLLAGSLFVNWRGATRYETQLWNLTPGYQYLMWDWSDLQFMR